MDSELGKLLILTLNNIGTALCLPNYNNYF